MEKYDVLKLKAAALYIINKSVSIDFIHLFKILYFAERSQYANYGQHLIKDSFCALPNGPVPSYLYDAVKAATKRSYSNHEYLHLIVDSIELVSSDADFILKAKCDADLDYLSEAEIEALDKSFSEHINQKFDVLSEESHDEAWEEAWNKSSNSTMNSLTIAKAGGASDGFLEYIAENERLENYIAG